MSRCSSTEANENSMAERINRILKEEFNFVLEGAALKAIPQVIETYNNYRPHASLDFKMPTLCHHSGRVEN